MKKVAILTTHRANNFGAVLQAYALVAACRELGSDAVILDWRSRHFEQMYHRIWRQRGRFIFRILYAVWRLIKERPTRKRFDRFRACMPVSAVVSDKQTLRTVENQYDAFIVGSDQIWNPFCTASADRPQDFERAYLLDFVHAKKKYAYGASIGGDVVSPSIVLPEMEAAWESFDLITMREKAGAVFVGNAIKKDISLVVDPVLLHGVEFWEKVEGAIQTKGKFVLLYNLRSSWLLFKLAQQTAETSGARLVDLLIPALNCGLFAKKTIAGPAEFISYIHEAESVFTSSFHAAVFSILYRKKIFLQLHQKGQKLNTRLDTLFTLAGLDGEVVYADDSDIVKCYDCSNARVDILHRRIKDSWAILQDMVC